MVIFLIQALSKFVAICRDIRVSHAVNVLFSWLQFFWRIGGFPQSRNFDMRKDHSYERRLVMKAGKHRI